MAICLLCALYGEDTVIDMSVFGKMKKSFRDCSPFIQTPKTQQQFQSQLLWQDESFAFGYDDSNRLLLILSLRLSIFASFVQNGSTAGEITG